MRLTLLCLLMFLTLAPAAAQRASTPPKQTTNPVQYIGLRYGPTLPRGLKSFGGSVVSAVDDEKEYAMSEIRRGSTRMLWFDRLTHRDDKGIAYWEVKDVLVLPAVPKNQILVYAMCLLNDKPDSEIAAIADHQPTAEYFTRVRKAWRANRMTEKFEPMPVKGIKCENPAAGL